MSCTEIPFSIELSAMFWFLWFMIGVAGIGFVFVTIDMLFLSGGPMFSPPPQPPPYPVPTFREMMRAPDEQA